ncbi:ATP-binding cassette domain-containing protein [Oricola cellulosilytica]|uniref:ATP-binding cassette domain-containing protein n=1 Tax=Oricola cellulosilytica TaxID=1429082 RepID=A0A4V2MNP4_9HYPH|nr:ATP-binding cassette domain-containing protein [Oricola cellulosilytica]TCD13866.1 ATP-binding cassette domain-containing protein [Oricola cellulosilytica]
MTGSSPQIVCDGLRFGYDPRNPDMHFDCVFPAGRITTLIGPSGSGKSTLLNLVAGFESPLEGRVLFGETDMTATPVSDRPVSMIFQENNLFAHLSVFDNVALGISSGLRLAPSQRATVEEALQSVELAGFGVRRPAELSGGERQRVALARVIVRSRPVLLLDEAFASLGPALRRDMLELLIRIQRQRAMTTVMVTHFPSDARFAASQAVFVSGGQVLATGSAETLLDPERTVPEIRAYLGGSGGA